MAAKALKPWALTEHETITSFEAWRNNMVYILGLDEKFQRFLHPNATWRRQTKNCTMRGFAGRDAAVSKVNLELMLGQIANFAPVISRSTIVKNSTSLQSIWEAIRLYYGILSNGGRFIDFIHIQASAAKRPETLYQEMYSFIEDSLMTHGNGLTHHEEECEDEEISPTLENLLVLLWLQKLHPELPSMVKERFGTELRKQTLASLRAEISQCIPSMLAMLESEESKICFSRSRTTQFNRKPIQSRRQCPLCKAARKSDFNHYLSECIYLPDEDKAFITKKKKPKTRSITIDVPLSDDQSDDSEEECDDIQESISSRRVDTKSSPCFKAFHENNAVAVTLDTGAEVNLIRQSTAHFLGVKVKRSTQTARQADGITPLDVVGETSFTLSRDGVDLTLEALVVSNMDVEVLAGMPFMTLNDVSLRPSVGEIVLQDLVKVSNVSEKSRNPRHVGRHVHAHVLRIPSKTTLWPGDVMEVTVPPALASVDVVAVEPRVTSKHSSWPKPTLCDVVSGKIRLTNSSDDPLSFPKNDHFCQALPLIDAQQKSTTPVRAVPRDDKTSSSVFSDDVSLDPDNRMPSDVKHQFSTLLKQFDAVFSPQYAGYNGHYGDFKAVVNMGPVLPPQRKGRVPQYSRDKLVELQEVFDHLESVGVFKRPEDVDVTVEYLNPSFLVKKPSGGHRLVTAFTDVGKYCKPSPSTMPNVDSTLRTIGAWQYVIVTDLTSAFYQIPLSKDSMKFCGVATPFKGVRVYQRAAMGMPGSETALEELMCRVLGPMLQDGTVAKLADDLYCGGSTYAELLQNFTRLLEALSKCDLRLSGKKTVICPKSTTILGWIWQDGSLHASPHRIATLVQTTVPTTVRGMRSFIGAYKFLSRVLPGSASVIAPLDAAIAGMASQDKLQQSDSLISNFRAAQDHLSNHKSITLPRSTDKLWIVTDGAQRNSGIGSTLYVSRGDKLLLSGFFSMKLKNHHTKWLPCEIEALGIATSINHFAPYILESKHQCSILTDSKPCVQAFDKLCRGEFSHSPRVATFLAAAGRYHVSIRHLAGNVNVPSDFASRNAPECVTPNCQVCSFAKQIDESVVRSLAVSDILSGKTVPPFSNRRAWISLQSECADLRRTHAHLLQGTRPSKKLTNIRDVKRYLNAVTLSHDGLLVVRKDEPLVPTRELIVVPRSLLPGLLTAMHISLDHPSAHQLKQVADRKYFALNMTDSVKEVTDRCHRCVSLRTLPQQVDPQSTCTLPDTIGSHFAADVMKRNRQLVFILREAVTSFTVSRLIDSETHESLRSALLCSCLDLRPLNSNFAIVRVDNAPGFVALRTDRVLAENHVKLEFGYVKNDNKNPVGEKGIQELEEEILRIQPNGGKISSLQLAMATARLNTRIRSRGLSSREMLLQREQFENTQIPVSDAALINQQHEGRVRNHAYSERSKAKISSSSPSIMAGDLVFLRKDLSKHHARDRYLVTSVDNDHCIVKKFSDSQIRCTSYRVKKSDCMLVPLLQRPEEGKSSPRDSNTESTDATTRSQNSSEAVESNTPNSQCHQIPETLTAPLPTYTDPGDNCDSSEPIRSSDRPKRSHRTPTYLQDYELY